MEPQKDDRTSMSSESSHYKSARDELTGLFIIHNILGSHPRNSHMNTTWSFVHYTLTFSIIVFMRSYPLIRLAGSVHYAWYGRQQFGLHLCLESSEYRWPISPQFTNLHPQRPQPPDDCFDDNVYFSLSLRTISAWTRPCATAHWTRVKLLWYPATVRVSRVMYIIIGLSPI